MTRGLVFYMIVQSYYKLTTIYTEAQDYHRYILRHW